MNKERRNKVSLILNEIELAKSKLQQVIDDEQFAYDNMPENLQYSMRGEESEECLEYLNEALELIESAVEQLSGI